MTRHPPVRFLSACALWMSSTVSSSVCEEYGLYPHPLPLGPIS